MCLFDDILKTKEKLEKSASKPPYAALMSQTNYDNLKKACKEESNEEVVSVDNVFGLIIEVMPYMPEDQILVVSKETYEILKHK